MTTQLSLRSRMTSISNHLFKLLAVVSDAAAGAAEGEGGADDEREAADLLGDLARFLGVAGGAADGHVQADGEHQVLKDLAVLAALDGLGVGTDHLDAVLVEGAAAEQGHGGVEGGLAAESGQQDELAASLDAPHFLDFPGDDLLEAFGGDGFEVGAVGKFGVGHDGGRVGVHQDNAVALFLEGFTGLRARIIELTRLPDDDRAGADDQDRMDIRALRHKGAGNKAHSGAVVSVKLLGGDEPADGKGKKRRKGLMRTISLLT